jgi:uncharacterized membrane protein
MSINGKLEKWAKEGLITATQQTAILEHERKFSGQKWKFGVTGAGLLSIVLGLSLIVASNWQDISNSIKLFVHIGINTLLAWLIWQWRNNDIKKQHREITLFLLWGLNLTLIALIGQIFQLSGQAYEAIRLWFWLTTPMILVFAQGSYLSKLWSLAFVIYVPYDLLNTVWDSISNKNISIFTLMGIALLLPLVTWGLGVYPAFVKVRENFASSLRTIAILTAVAFASFSSIRFYENNNHDYHFLIPVFFAILAIILRFTLNRMSIFSRDQKLTIDLLCLSGFFVTIAFIVYIKSDLLAMLHFMAFWILAGAIWQRQGYAHAVSWAVAIVSIRLCIGFLEVFNGLMQSGFGFVVTGLVLMSIAWGTRKIQKHLNRGVA